MNHSQTNPDMSKAKRNKMFTKTRKYENTKKNKKISCFLFFVFS